MKGNFESQKPIVTHRGRVENKAPQHYDVSKKKSPQNVMTLPFAPPEKHDKKESAEMILVFDENKSLVSDKKAMHLINKFMDNYPDLEDISIDFNSITISNKYSNDFINFLAKHGYELDKDFNAYDFEVYRQNMNEHMKKR